VNRSLLFQVTTLMVTFTVLVALLMLYVLPNRQAAVLEASMRGELASLAAAYSISVRSALEQQDLSALEELNKQISFDRRNPVIAVINTSDDIPEIFAVFPASEEIEAIDEIFGPKYVAADRTFESDIIDGRVVVMFKREALDDRLWSLTQLLYFSFAFICLLQVAFARQLSTHILMPIIKAAGFSDALGERRYSGKLRRENRQDEIGTLITSLRRLQVTLRSQDRENRRLFLSLEDTVAERTAELTKALEAKDAFTANVSHELRTPLHSIIASLDLMADSAANPKEAKNYLGIARRASQALLLLINELLDFQRWEHEKVTLLTEPTELYDFLSDIEKTTAMLFDDSAIRFVAEIDETRNARVMMDQQRIGQILMNLLGNARKFTREGEVVLEVSVLSRTDFYTEFLFVVADTGIGIDADHLERVGEPYFQAGDGLNRKFSGTGLGLSIVRKLLDSMGSKLNISSELDRGSVFDFSLKLRNLEWDSDNQTGASLQETVLQETKPNVSSLDFLYVEDSETNQLVMSAMMERLGVKLTMASSAKEGFDILQKQDIDIVITDIQMPEHSGLDLISWIKQDSDFADKLRIFACTANASSDAVQEFEDAGFESVLTKPLDLQVLERFLAQL
jgi:signal transduction histidine kinase/CheY-like chemotaxis protein